MDSAVRPVVGKRVQVGRLSIDALRFDAAVDAVQELVARGEGGMVFTPNVDHVVLAERDEALRAAYEAADLSLADGVPVLWATRVLGSPLPEKVSGADLVRPLVARAAACGWRIYLLGGREGVAARARRVLEREHPTVNVVGTSAPEVDLSKDMSSQKEVLAEVRASRPDLLFLALGAPKQEIWAHRIRDEVRPAVILGVGAALDFIAGTVKRAPAWISASGFEWLYRLGQEPTRLWKRYLLRDPQFAAIVAKQWWHSHIAPRV